MFLARSAQNLAGIASCCAVARDRGRVFQQCRNLPGTPFQQGISDSHSLIEFSDSPGKNFRRRQLGDGMGGGRNGRFWGAPFFGQNLANTAFLNEKMQNRGTPKTAVPTTTHPIAAAALLKLSLTQSAAKRGRSHKNQALMIRVRSIENCARRPVSRIALAKRGPSKAYDIQHSNMISDLLAGIFTPMFVLILDPGSVRTRLSVRFQAVNSDLLFLAVFDFLAFPLVKECLFIWVLFHPFRGMLGRDGQSLSFYLVDFP